MISKVRVLSIGKRCCEKYLFQYVKEERCVQVKIKIIHLHLKSGTIERK
jgi:hypothetical protein